MQQRLQKIEEMLLAQPKDNFLRHALALENIKLGNDAIAKEIFESILTDDMQYVGSYYHLAKTLERLSLTENAIAVYEKGMEIAKQLKDMHSYNELQAAYEDLVY